MRILLVNDDGIDAEGINILARSLEKDHQLIIVAPDNQRSAQSHAITVFEPIYAKEIKLEGIDSKAYSISGTPVDCVRAAISRLIDEPVDLVVSGINTGLNAGMDVLYSGTVSAALEANMHNLPAIALSAEWKDGRIDYNLAVDCGKYILERIGKQIIEGNILLNINTPYVEDDGFKGIRVCKIGDMIYDYYSIEEDEQNDRKLLKIQGRQHEKFQKDTDRFFLSKGYATITPLHYDLTNYDLLGGIRNWVE